MWEGAILWASWALGLDAEELGMGHMAVRAAVVFVFAVVLVRLGETRFLGKNTAFDVILGVMLGSITSRAITGQSPFFPTLGAACVLIAMHWILAKIGSRFNPFARLIKGKTCVLVRDGEVDWDAMRRCDIGRNDLLGALRLRAKMTGWEDVKEARLERNGEISIIPKDS